MRPLGLHIAEEYQDTTTRLHNGKIYRWVYWGLIYWFVECRNLVYYFWNHCRLGEIIFGSFSGVKLYFFIRPLPMLDIRGKFLLRVSLALLAAHEGRVCLARPNRRQFRHAMHFFCHVALLKQRFTWFYGETLRLILEIDFFFL